MLQWKLFCRSEIVGNEQGIIIGQKKFPVKEELEFIIRMSKRTK